MGVDKQTFPFSFSYLPSSRYYRGGGGVSVTKQIKQTSDLEGLFGTKLFSFFFSAFTFLVLFFFFFFFFRPD